MKISMTVISIAIALFASMSPAPAADGKLQEGMKKVGAAIVWPFKKMGEGLVALGHGAKKLVGKG